MSKNTKLLAAAVLPILAILLAPGPAAAQRCVDPAPGLVSWWPGDEADSAIDIWDGNNGTLVNDVEFVPGHVGTAFDFGRSLDHVRVPYSVNLDFTQHHAYTVDFWIKADPAVGHPALVEKWKNQASGYPIAVRLNTEDFGGPTGTISCASYDLTNNPFATSTSTVDDGQFHHVACVFDHPNKKIEVYIDGKLEDTETYASTLGDISNNHGVFFGIRGNLNSETDFNRVLDEISIYNRALNHKDIKDIWRADSAGKCRAMSIDIKPGNSQNTINPKSNGVIPVAILSTNELDAGDVDPSSVKFGPQGAGIAHSWAHLVDVDGDQDLDLLLHIRTQESGIRCGDTSASLSAVTSDGVSVEGSDAIRTVGCGSQEAKKSKKGK